MKEPDPLVSLWGAVEGYDAEAVDHVLGHLLGDRPLDRAVTEFMLPFLREVGERWEAGTLSVAHEHFFTGLLTRRLSALAPTMAEGDGPVVVVACPPGERHEIVPLCVSLLLQERGVRVRFLGADTPLVGIAGAARTSGADAVVLAATRATALTAHARSVHKLAERHSVWIGGAGTDDEVARVVGARLLPPDPVAAVEVLVEAAELMPSGSW